MKGLIQRDEGCMHLGDIQHRGSYNSLVWSGITVDYTRVRFYALCCRRHVDYGFSASTTALPTHSSPTD